MTNYHSETISYHLDQSIARN